MNSPPSLNLIPFLLLQPSYIPSWAERLACKLSLRFSILWSLSKACALPVSPSVYLVVGGIWVEKEPPHHHKGSRSEPGPWNKSRQPIPWKAQQLHTQETQTPEPDFLVWDPTPPLTSCLMVGNYSSNFFVFYFKFPPSLSQCTHTDRASVI